jgi:ribosomal protein S12 methylthiotransferase
MVGFPGETRKDFGELVRFVEETQFDHLGVFTYSPEEGTRAFRLEGNVEPEVAAERYHELMTIQAEISRKRNRKRKDTHVPVLIEGFSEESDLLLQGRTRFQAPEIDGVTYINKGTAEIGTITKVHITDAFEYDLVGEIVT